MRCPVPGQAVRQWAGQQVRAAHAMYRGVQGEQLGGRDDQSGQHGVRLAEQQRRPDAAREGQLPRDRCSNSSTSGAMRSATATVTWGRPAGARTGRSAASRSAQICEAARRCRRRRAARPNAPSAEKTGHPVAVERVRTHRGELGGAQPAGTAGSSARSGPRRTSADLLDASTTPGGSGQFPITSPAHGRFMRGKRFQRQSGVVEGSEVRGGDHQHRGSQVGRQVA